MSALSETVNQNTAQAAAPNLSWNLRYRLSFHQRFLASDFVNDSKLALETLNSILDLKQSKEGIEKAVKDLQARVSKNPKDLAEVSLLAMCYEEGLGIAKNANQAFTLHSQAAKVGYAPSQNRLAFFYEDHPNRNKQKLNDQHLITAIALYKEAAAQNYMPAMYNLGKLYTDPFTVFNQKIRKEGFELITKTADAEYAFSQGYLGQQYEAGFVIDPNQELAVKYTRLAAQQGSPEAEGRMGDFYMSGEDGLEKDPKQAVEWYTRAADKGNVIAQLKLLNCYEKGRGVEKNAIKALHYRHLADNNENRFMEKGQGFYIKGPLEQQAMQGHLPYQAFTSFLSQIAADDQDNGPDANDYQDYFGDRNPDLLPLKEFQFALFSLFRGCGSVLGTVGGAVRGVVTAAVNPCLDRCKKKRKKD